MAAQVTLILRTLQKAALHTILSPMGDLGTLDVPLPLYTL
jgi:hypothetical protein